MKPDINWNAINTVLLDLDGTLLDLYFDNYFWQEYLPEQWGKINGMDADIAKSQLRRWYAQEAGTLSWYCLDFWTERLNFDVFGLKQDVKHLIKTRPYTEPFLEKLQTANYELIMVTNAHQKLVKMKMERTGIGVFFDHIVSAHEFGYAKEEPKFWKILQSRFSFDCNKTVLIDDNLVVLRTARKFGIQHLLSIAKPDSSGCERDTAEFCPVYSFNDIIFDLA